MIPVPANLRVWIATGHTDVRRGMTGLALQVQEILKRDPHANDIYLFRGKRGDLMKCLWHGARPRQPQPGNSTRLSAKPRNGAPEPARDNWRGFSGAIWRTQ